MLNNLSYFCPQYTWMNCSCLLSKRFIDAWLWDDAVLSDAVRSLTFAESIWCKGQLICLNESITCLKDKGTVELRADDSVSPAWFSEEQQDRKPKAAGRAPSTGSGGGKPVLTGLDGEPSRFRSARYKASDNRTHSWRAPVCTAQLVPAAVSSPGMGREAASLLCPPGELRHEPPHPSSTPGGSSAQPSPGTPRAEESHPACSSTALNLLKFRGKKAKQNIYLLAGFNAGYNPAITTERRL